MPLSVQALHFNISSLYHVDMEIADERGSEPIMSSVEVCECPPGFDGFSCEVSVKNEYQSYNNVLDILHLI